MRYGIEQTAQLHRTIQNGIQRESDLRSQLAEAVALLRDALNAYDALESEGFGWARRDGQNIRTSTRAFLARIDGGV